MTTTRPRLLTVARSDYLNGLAAAEIDAAKCNTADDATWYQKVTFDNLWDSRPQYVAGYADGFGQ